MLIDLNSGNSCVLSRGFDFNFNYVVCAWCDCCEHCDLCADCVYFVCRQILAWKPLAKPWMKPLAWKPLAWKPLVKHWMKPWMKPLAKPLAKKPLAKPLAKPLVKPLVKPLANKPLAKPLAKPLVKPWMKPLAKKPLANKPLAKKPLANKPLAKPLAWKPLAKPWMKPLATLAKPWDLILRNVQLFLLSPNLRISNHSSIPTQKLMFLRMKPFHVVLGCTSQEIDEPNPKPLEHIL